MMEWFANIIQKMLDFPNILNASIAASWMVLAVLVLRFSLKKAPKWTRVALWGLVAVRLLLPFSIESAFSLIPSAQTVPEEVLRYEGVQLKEPAHLDVILNPVISGNVSIELEQTADRLQIHMIHTTFIWFIGIALLFLYTIISYWSLHRKVDTAVLYRDNVFQSENVSSPFVLGIIRPRIYVPFKMDAQDMKHVIAHEQAHLKRKDHWWKPLGFLLLAIHWFNPVMWLAYILLCRDIELACDEKVIKELNSEQRADYTQALLSCSINRRMIAACPLAFGEVGVKERVKSVMNYRKPAFWIIILATLACVGVAVCFLTNPKKDNFTLQIVVPAGSQEQFVYTDEEISTTTNTIKIWSGDGLGDTEVLLSPVNETTETGYVATYLAHGMPVVFDAQKDTWFKVGVNIQNPTNEDIIVYVKVENVEVRISDKSYTVRKWFDYLDDPSKMQWDGRLEINLPEFPDVTFRWYPEKMEAITEDEIIPLYTGMPIWNTYFCDLTGDGHPELCSSLSMGSGIIDNRIIIYDYANGASYSLQDRGTFDYTLRQDEKDGQLYVDKNAYRGGELLSTGILVFKDECIQIFGEDIPTVTIGEITDPTDDPNFSYDTAVEKIYEDEDNEYFLSGLYSQSVIVHYTDGMHEDIVTALNAGRATIADLDKFGIQYWAEPKADELHAAIINAIQGKNKSGKQDGQFDCASFVILKQEELCIDSDPPTPMQVTVYGMALHQGYGFSGHTFQEVEGSHIPTAITFDVIDGKYVLKEYWTPRDGSYYVQDIRDKFPNEVENDALDTQKYILAQKQECYKQAVQYGNIDTDYAIEYLFEVIESSPLESSRPQDYIAAHPIEYRELTYYGDYTLKYIFTKFLEGEQTGLRGQLMRSMLDELAPEAQLRLYAETGQAYFDEWKAGAIRVSEQHDMDWIKEKQPAMYLFLQMVKD